jgi:hypothetical protein
MSCGSVESQYLVGPFAKRDGYTSGERKKIYDLISELASHASYPGISMTTTGPSNMAQVGPFFDEKKLKTWLQEIAMRLSHAAVVLVSNPEGSDLKLLMTRKHFLEVVNKWWATYRGVSPQAAPGKDASPDTPSKPTNQ